MNTRQFILVKSENDSDYSIPIDQIKIISPSGGKNIKSVIILINDMTPYYSKESPKDIHTQIQLKTMTL